MPRLLGNKTTLLCIMYRFLDFRCRLPPMFPLIFQAINVNFLVDGSEYFIRSDNCNERQFQWLSRRALLFFELQIRGATS